ncbi:hypothetical protein NC651_030270 [Populus alba x Populus x berolinensis]|nr:hypothetical protein NC651_030270 [Populus alba x Populus x berolinensis]
MISEFQFQIPTLSVSKILHSAGSANIHFIRSQQPRTNAPVPRSTLFKDNKS